MRFVFYHHEMHGPFSLEQLYAGEAPYGGSVARLRLLFWIAERGHEVYLVGNVENGKMKGVSSLAGDSNLEFLLLNNSAEPSLLVLNNPPDEQKWRNIKNFKRTKVGIVLWAGNPFSWEWLKRLDCGELNRIVCVSNSHREAYRLYPGFKKIEFCYSGVDVDLLKTGSAGTLPAKTVVFTSIPRRSKGIHQMFKSWPIIRKAVPTATLRVCGSALMHDPGAHIGRTGVLDANLESEFPHFFGNYPFSAKEAGIELMGIRKMKEVCNDTKSAAVAVVNLNLSGSAETFCRSAVEAQVAGVPVVGAARGSLPEVVAHGKTGLLVNRKNPASLAKTIITLLKDDPLRQRMGLAGIRWAPPFANYELIAKDWEAIAERDFSGKPAPVRPRQPHDLLRYLSYGRARLWVKRRIKYFLGSR